MLKKAGIVTAAVAATAVAAAPLAFAGDYPKSHEVHRTHGVHKTHDRNSSVDYDYDFDYTVDNSVDREQYNRCSFAQNSRSRNGLLGVVSLLGDQTQAANCTNIGDVTVVDLDPTS